MAIYSPLPFPPGEPANIYSTWIIVKFHVQLIIHLKEPFKTCVLKAFSQLFFFLANSKRVHGVEVVLFYLMKVPFRWKVQKVLICRK